MMEVHMVELAALAIVVISIIIGACRGLIKTLFGLVRGILAFIAAILLSPVISTFLPKDMAFKQGASFVVAFIITCIALSIINYALGIVDHIPLVNEVNKLAGAVAGAFFGLVLLCLALMLLGIFENVTWCGQIAALVKKSEILMYIHNLNPLPRLWTQIGLPMIYK